MQETRIKQGFTLIELMVAVTISMLVIGGVTLTLSGYYNTERVGQTAVEIRSLLSMARNLAVTNQVPSGYVDNMNYVLVTTTRNGKVEAFAGNNTLGVGESYFSKNTADAQINTTVINNLRFAAGTGKLVDGSGNPLPQATEVTVTVSGDNVSRQIIINSLGVVK